MSYDIKFIDIIIKRTPIIDESEVSLTLLSNGEEVTLSDIDGEIGTIEIIKQDLPDEEVMNGLSNPIVTSLNVIAKQSLTRSKRYARIRPHSQSIINTSRQRRKANTTNDTFSRNGTRTRTYGSSSRNALTPRTNKFSTTIKECNTIIDTIYEQRKTIGGLFRHIIIRDLVKNPRNASDSIKLTNATWLKEILEITAEHLNNK